MDEPGLLGRDEQLRVLREALGRLPEAGGALVMQGGPGVGKTAVLRATADHARTAGRRILEAAGCGDDTPFSGLRELLRPLPAAVDKLPAGQNATLRSALVEVDSEPPPETLKVALAAFHLITTSGAELPVVLIVDDVRRLDRSTRDVLAFIARRVGDNPFVVIVASRGIRTRAVAPVLAVPVLVELPTAWSVTGPPGSWTHLPVSPALATAFAAGLAELPTGTRDALLVAAVDHVGDLAEILAAASALAEHTVAVDFLDCAAEASLIRLDRATVRFHHAHGGRCAGPRARPAPATRRRRPSVLAPHRRCPHRPLLPGEEDDNAAHRKVRARVEHVIGRMKNYKILPDCRQRGVGLHHAVQAVAHFR